MEVRFEDLCVEGDVFLGRRVLPTLYNATINTIQEALGLLHLTPAKKQPMKILNGLTGIIRPSRMTLVLGPPGSGKSTFLRALAGKLDPRLRVRGRATYNGRHLNDFIPQRTCAYVSQYDLHHAELTVRETLDFSRRMLGSDESYEMLMEVVKLEKTTSNVADSEIDMITKAAAMAEEQGSKLVTDYVLEILGLRECADVTIGDEMRRGISGGQKKRVTIGAP